MPNWPSSGSITSMQLPALSAAPAVLKAGMVVMADRTNWDPLSKSTGGAYLTMYRGTSSGWGAITAQLD